jgi:hypothetical protein
MLFGLNETIPFLPQGRLDSLFRLVCNASSPVELVHLVSHLAEGSG